MLTACLDQTGSSTGSRPKIDNVLRYDVNAPFTSLYPAGVKFSGSTNIFPLLYSYLFVPDVKGELIPDLATQWTFNADKQKWTIYLRNNAMFHNNRSVTAHDVKFSLERYIARKEPDLKSVINRIIATSEKILTLYLKQNDSLILYKLWDIEIVPYTENENSEYEDRPVGSGPFKFAHRQGNQIVTLEANAHYYAGPPALNQIVFYYQPDREKAWTRLLTGKTDIAQEISPQNYRITRQYQDWFYFDTYAMPYYTILLYNTYDPLFLNLNVRKALTLAIDRDYIVNHILNGFGRIAAGPMGMDSPFHNPDIKPMPFDPIRALKLMHQAGWRPDEAGYLHKDGKPFEFTIFVFKESQVEKKVARFIQLCLNSLGIKTHLRALAYEDIKASYFQNTRFQAVLTELNGAYRRPEFIKTLWSYNEHHKSIAGCFRHPEVNRLIEKSFATTDPIEQKALLRELDLLIESLQPGSFLFQKTAIDAMSRRFNLPHPFTLTHEGIFRLKYASINEAHNR